MKHGVKPTVAQRKLIQKRRLDPSNAKKIVEVFDAYIRPQIRVLERRGEHG